MVLAISNEKHALRCMGELKRKSNSADADGYARLKPSEIIESPSCRFAQGEAGQTLKHVIDKVWPAEVEYVLSTPSTTASTLRSLRSHPGEGS